MSEKPPRLTNDDLSQETAPSPLQHLLTDEIVGPKRPCLVVVSGPKLGEIVVINKSIVVGRDAKAALCLAEDEGISRMHARIDLDGEQVVLTDLGSANGTFIGNERMSSNSSQPLREGDRIRIGQTTILKYARYDTIEEQAQRQMVEGALRDGLTRAFNRRYFLDRLASEIGFSRRHLQPIVLLLLDVDHLRAINARLGHGAGDGVLRRLAEILAETVRVEDVLARYGPEEFAILAHGITESQGALLGERLRKLVGAGDFECERTPISVAVSIGVAAYPFDVEETDNSMLALKLIARAETALDRAKKAGRNQVSR